MILLQMTQGHLSIVLQWVIEWLNTRVRRDLTPRPTVESLDLLHYGLDF